MISVCPPQDQGPASTLPFLPIWAAEFRFATASA
jgi:hypothetical protein